MPPAWPVRPGASRVVRRWLEQSPLNPRAFAAERRFGRIFWGRKMSLIWIKSTMPARAGSPSGRLDGKDKSKQVAHGAMRNRPSTWMLCHPTSRNYNFPKSHHVTIKTQALTDCEQHGEHCTAHPNFLSFAP
jgi:hypothetical protein